MATSSLMRYNARYSHLQYWVTPRLYERDRMSLAVGGYPKYITSFRAWRVHFLSLLYHITRNAHKASPAKIQSEPYHDHVMLCSLHTTTSLILRLFEVILATSKHENFALHSRFNGLNGARTYKDSMSKVLDSNRLKRPPELILSHS